MTLSQVPRGESAPRPPAVAMEPGARRLAERLGALQRQGALALPLPGAGRTWARWRALAALAQEDVALGRLAEGHADALAILAEARRRPGPDWLLGVWAAEGPGSRVEARRIGDELHLHGVRRYCSAARTLSHCLLTVDAAGQRLLVIVDLASPGVGPVAGTWQALGMADTDSLDVAFDLCVPGTAVVGPAGFYLERPGFWAGALGVTACWWGGARGVLGDARTAVERRPDPHRLAQLGLATAELETIGALLENAAHRCDGGIDGAATRRLALSVRAAVAGGCARLLDCARACLGSAAICRDHAVAQRLADLEVYLTQHHGRADHEALGRLSLEQSPADA